MDRKRRKLIIGCTSPEHLSAAEEIAGNADLLTELLLRLSAKSLIRFKCVSKQWLSLISDSQFTSNHAGRNSLSSISGLYFRFPSCNQQIESVSFDGHPSLPPTLAFLDGVVADSTATRIEHSCNGLMLCSNGYQNRQYIVCNSTTTKYTVLPDPGATSSGAIYLDNNIGAFLAFDPSKSPHYKVLLFNDLYAINGNFHQIKIYRSESSSWKHISVAEPRGERFPFKVFWNGAIHGISYDNLHIRFEVEEEKLIETPMPPNPKILSSGKVRYFGECGGDLLLIQTRHRSAMGFRILAMDRDYCRWIVKYRVDLRSISSVSSEIVHITRSCKFNVLCVVKGGNEKDFTLVLAIPGKIVAYNLKSKTLKVLRDLLPVVFDDQVPTWYNTYQFIASLSPV